MAKKKGAQGISGEKDGGIAISPSDKGKGISLEQERAAFLYLVIVSISFWPILASAIMSGSIILFSEVLSYIPVFVSSLIGWRTLRATCSGQLSGFDYGTGKFETMGAMVGSIIYIIGLLIAGGFAVDRLFNPTELQQLGTLFGAFYMMVEVSIDGWQWRRNLRLARKKYSPIIEMQWRANRADTFFGLAVFLSLLLTIALQAFSWSIYIDPISALILVVYAIYLFFPSLTSGFDDLIDKTLKEELQILIVRRLAETFDGYDTFHDVRSRRSGGRILIDIGLSFSPEKTVREIMETVNQLTHKIENDIVDSEVRVAILPMPPMVSKQEPGCHGA